MFMLFISYFNSPYTYTQEICVDKNKLKIANNSFKDMAQYNGFCQRNVEYTSFHDQT